MTDLMWLDATASAALVRSGQASPLELVDAAIERIESLNPALNAVIHRRDDKARTEASGPLPDGPFRGVPIVIKDLTCMTAGDPYHAGTRVLKNLAYVADHDTYLATKFRQAGFVVVGRTSTPELGSTITTEPLAYGPCRNPWNTNHSTGGSSGGSAAAVAAGMVAVGHANDGGGSIRIPASECGLVGLKPSRGRVSQGPDSGESWNGATIEGAVTRTVRDAAGVLDAIAGYMPGDPYTAPPPARPFVDEVGADPGRLHIGLLDHPADDESQGHPECVAAVAHAGRVLESLGHQVEIDHPAALAEQEFGEHFLRIVASWCAADLDAMEAMIGRPLTEDDIERSNLTMRHIGRSIGAPGYLASEVWMHGFTRRMAAWWHPADAGDDGAAGFDVLVTPVIAAPPPPIGWLSDPDHGGSRLRELLRFTAQFNCTGQPAVSLPLHWSADGLPVGVQFVAAYGREDLLIRLAAQLEAAVPWRGRRPGGQ